MVGGCFSTSHTDGTEDSYRISLRSLMAAKQTPLPSHSMAKKIIERKLGLSTRKTLQARTNLLDTACHSLAKAKQRTLVSFPPSYVYLKSDTTLFPLPLPPGYQPSTSTRNSSRSSSISKSIKNKSIDMTSTDSTASNTIDVNSATSSYSSNSPRSPACQSQSNSTVTACNISSCEALTPSSSTSSSVFSAAPSSLSQSSSFSSSSTNSCNSLAPAFENESSFFSPLPLPSSTHKVVQVVDSPLKEFSALEIARACDNFDDTYKLRDGSMGPFYKLFLPEEQSIVTITRVSTNLSRKKWRAQMQMLASLGHPNLCKVIGFSYERAAAHGLELNTGFIVYEGMAGNESLEEFVEDVEKGHSHIDWSTRLKIAIGVAEGLSFLLQTLPVGHVSYGDLSMSNIIIDFSLNAKLFDFVLSSRMDERKEKKSSHVVQAFGNVLLKLFNFVSYPEDGGEYSQGFKERSQMEKAYSYPSRDAKLVIQLAASCLLTEDSLRPSLQHVAFVLRSIEPKQHVTNFFIKRSKSLTHR